MISVIFLNYNRREDLRRSLQKIFKQQDVEFEVIVVDQNSTDGSISMIQEEFSEVRLFPLKENLGVAGGRNYGAEKSLGEYLVFIDDDAEFISQDALYKTSLVFDNNKNINVIAFNVNGHPERPEKYKFFSNKKDKFTNSYIGCGHAIRQEVFYKLGGYTKELFFWGEEIEFAIKTFSIPNNRILFKGDIVLFHRVSQISRLKWKEGRFYYKVRNRMAVMHTFFPFPISTLYFTYYCCAYFIRAVQLKEVNSFFKGIKDSFNLKLVEGKNLNFQQSKNYILPK